jgi:hypothetical protein
MTKPIRSVVALICALSVAAAAADAQAFFQKTSLEGTLGNDVSGVWLAVHHVMPQFRVRVDRDPSGASPFSVGPIPKDLAPALGTDPAGVVIAKLTDPGAGEKYGIFEGDVITKVNTTPVANVEEYEKAIKDVKEWFLVTLRRPALKFSTARLLKIDYKATEREVDGTSQLEEKIDVHVADVALPFQDQIEKGRMENKFFAVSDAQTAKLGSDWYKLSPPAKAIFVNGEHRVVAAANYDEALRQDDNLKGTLFAIVSTLQSNPLAGGGGRSIGIYGAQKIAADRISGTYVESTLASAPFPISIEFNGRFEMTKVAPFSNEDVDFRAAQVKAEGKEKQECESRSAEVAPDVPANIPPAPKDQPAVAE